MKSRAFYDILYTKKNIEHVKKRPGEFYLSIECFVGLAMEEVLRIVCMRVYGVVCMRVYTSVYACVCVYVRACVRLIERGEDLNCD